MERKTPTKAVILRGLTTGVDTLYNKYQLNHSIQINRTPLSTVDDILLVVGSLKGKSVCIIANYDTVTYIKGLKAANAYFKANSMEYTTDYDFKEITFITDIVDLHEAETCNIVLANLNEPATINMMGKKFDVVIGNPPYSEGRANTDLYNKFTEKALGMSKRFVALVTPARFASSRKVSLTKMCDAMDAFGVSNFTKLSDKTFGNVVTISGGACFWVCDNESDGVLSDFTDTEYTRLLARLQSTNSEVIDFARGGVQILEKDVDEYSKTQQGNYNTPHIIRIKGGSIVKVFVDASNKKVRDAKYSVLFSERGGLVPKCEIYEGEFTSTINVCSVTFDTMLECDNFIKFTNSRVFKFMVTVSVGEESVDNVKTVVNNPGWFRDVCLNLDFSKEWSEQSLINLLNLNEEDVKLINTVND